MGIELVKREVSANSPALDSVQAGAVEHRGSPVVISGGPGTGKTSILIEAALYVGIGAYAVMAHGVPPLRAILISLLVFVSLRFFLTLGN